VKAWWSLSPLLLAWILTDVDKPTLAPAAAADRRSSIRKYRVLDSCGSSVKPSRVAAEPPLVTVVVTDDEDEDGRNGPTTHCAEDNTLTLWRHTGTLL